MGDGGGGGWGGGGVERYFRWCDLFLCPIYDFEYFVLFSGGRGGEGAATEPALRGRAAVRKRRK